MDDLLASKSQFLSVGFGVLVAFLIAGYLGIVKKHALPLAHFLGVLASGAALCYSLLFLIAQYVALKEGVECAPRVAPCKLDVFTEDPIILVVGGISLAWVSANSIISIFKNSLPQNEK